MLSLYLYPRALPLSVWMRLKGGPRQRHCAESNEDIDVHGHFPRLLSLICFIYRWTVHLQTLCVSDINKLKGSAWRQSTALSLSLSLRSQSLVPPRLV